MCLVEVPTRKSFEAPMNLQTYYLSTIFDRGMHDAQPSSDMIVRAIMRCVEDCNDSKRRLSLSPWAKSKMI